MMVYCIELKEQKWKMRAEVISFKALSGAHSRENLGRYVVGLIDGIMGGRRVKGMPFYVLTSPLI